MDRAAAPSGSSGLDDDRARGLYREMLVARCVDEEGVALQRQGSLPAYAPMRGQEAAQVGSAGMLDRTRDFAFPTYRELGVAVAMGVDLVGYMATHAAVWHGGLYDPVDARFGSINAVVGGPVTHAVGWAMGARLDDTGGAGVAYFGDGASSQGDVHEAMNFAGVYRLPVVFFCQHNGWAISLPSERQVAGGSIAARAAGYGIAGREVDGNDVLAVREATGEALGRARHGGGPTVIEARTYRMGPHSTSDDPSRYRTRDEESAWQRRDPVTTFARRLLDTGAASEAELAEDEASARERAARVREGLAALRDRPGDELFSFVYRESTDALLEQHRSWRNEVAAREEERVDA